VIRTKTANTTKLISTTKCSVSDRAPASRAAEWMQHVLKPCIRCVAY